MSTTSDVCVLVACNVTQQMVVLVIQASVGIFLQQDVMEVVLMGVVCRPASAYHCNQLQSISATVPDCPHTDAASACHASTSLTGIMPEALLQAKCC